MRIATWNVNSLKARMPKVEDWLGYASPDILCMQETKLADATFPAMAFQALGYEVAYHGNGRWNGVAIASKVGIEEAHAGFAGEELADIEECRFIMARCAGIQVASVYVPNGRSVGSEFYEQKLQWLDRLYEDVAQHCSPDDPIAVCGDFNVAPTDLDVWDAAKVHGATHVSPPEREAVARLEKWGLRDSFRMVYPEQAKLFSWWDYRAGDFHQGRGMRIDLLLMSEPLTKGVRWALIDREARKGLNSDKPPSDHAPVMVDLDWP